MASKRTIELVQATVPALQAHGLTPMISMLKQRDTLLSWGVPAGRVHYEVFGPDQIVSA